MYFSIQCPQTRDDWKLEFLFCNSVASKSIVFDLWLEAFIDNELQGDFTNIRF